MQKVEVQGKLLLLLVVKINTAVTRFHLYLQQLSGIIMPWIGKCLDTIIILFNNEQ